MITTIAQQHLWSQVKLIESEVLSEIYQGLK